MKNYKLTLCYDGTRYKGWQKQGNTDNTIQAKMEGLLSRLLHQKIEVSGSGRTDAGVHAREQVCSFHAATELTDEELLREIRRFLPEDIGAVSLSEVSSRFHARLSCKEKTYQYHIWTSQEPNVFARRYQFVFTDPLDDNRMLRTAELLCGRHDFTSFTSNKHMKKSAVRELRHIEIARDGNCLRFSFTGDGFLYNMVRILTGTLLESGAGIRNPESIPQVFAALDRSAAGFTAPPQGLILYEVKY